MGFDIRKIYVHKNPNIIKGRNGKLYRANVGCKCPSVDLTIDPETNLKHTKISTVL